MAVTECSSHKEISERLVFAARNSANFLPNVNYVDYPGSASLLLRATIERKRYHLDEQALRCAVEVLEQEEHRERSFLFQRYSEEQRSYFMLHYKDFHASILQYVASCGEIEPAAQRSIAEGCLAQAKKLASWSAVLRLIAAQEILVPLQCP